MAFSFGDVVWADLDPAAGHEQGKRRPLIVVSNDKFNAHCTLTMTIPITTTDNGYPLHIDIGEVPAEDADGTVHGFAEVEQLKSLDLRARNAVRVGRVDTLGMDRIAEIIIGCVITDEMSVYVDRY